ncbi:hypothetical protein Hamer_G010011 [Homarus americanus]|uniref:Uncharacterized protein n=1 Tax=Homarus americanus TaxID=6706 RepID=A0A8J5JGC0_HOMAM|nr:hypothetical protein Hamer_G010011 [Homarus americanus]
MQDGSPIQTARITYSFWSGRAKGVNSTPSRTYGEPLLGHGRRTMTEHHSNSSNTRRMSGSVFAEICNKFCIIASLSNRLQEVIAKNGGWAKY